MKESWDRGFLGHPKGLAILFFTEMWERFSYYGMRAILVLYIYSSADTGGLGWTKADALVLYGWYTMLVYVMSIPGGILADRVFGQKKMVMFGGGLLVIGHGVLAIEHEIAFFTGLGLIVLGVGGLKPNISTMVGGLYPEGDARRDKGFTLFYIGINVGAFFAALIVGWVGETVGWHYGFGLAGIGMLLGQIVFIWGQKYLKGIGDFVATPKVEGTNTSQPLTKQEKDRMLVLMLSFIIIVVFWGAFEQAGGLMNLYTDEKVDRNFFSLFEIPASVFQSFNALFIMIFGTAVAFFWALRKKRKKESSSLFKMAVGTIIMGLGFVMMAMASWEASAEPFGKAAMYWVVLAYLLHTLGELCASPVALSFITKLAPLKYASIMMGVYFAATGFGNKLAGFIGESAQAEPIEITFNSDKKTSLKEYGNNYRKIEGDSAIAFKGKLYMEGDKIVIQEWDKKKNIRELFKIKEKSLNHLKEIIREETTKPLHASIALEKNVEAKKVKKDKGNAKDYEGSIRVMEVENSYEFNIFLIITGFTVIFGLILIVFLKPLKRLTHGVEEREE